MPLNFSAAHSSRITKAKSRNALLRRTVSSPFADHLRRKPVQRSLSKPEVADNEDDLLGDRLDDTGPITSLADELSLRDVSQVLQYARSHMFDELPERGGMNSTRIAEILNFRRDLPPIVTVAYVHAMLRSPTAVEKGIAELTKAGVIRRLVVPGRGVGGASVGEGLVLFKDWELRVKEELELPDDVKCVYIISYITWYLIFPTGRFIELLRGNSTAVILPQVLFQPSEATILMGAGFLTSSSQLGTSPSTFLLSDTAARGTLTSITSISRAASGTLAAIGGDGAFHSAGGGGAVLERGTSQAKAQLVGETEQPTKKHGEFCLSLPNTGPYLRLLVSARGHLMSLLSKSKYQEAPLYLLRERWDGGVARDGAASKRKRTRGEFVGILPGRTRKWKQFYGLTFDWVLAECLGAGLIEVFDTGSVGRGVRIVS